MDARALRFRDGQTEAVISGPYLTPEFGFHRGFQVFTDLYPRDLFELREENRYLADRTVDKAIDVLESAGGARVFLFVHCIDPHWPYAAPWKLWVVPKLKQKSWIRTSLLMYVLGDDPERRLPHGPHRVLVRESRSALHESFLNPADPAPNAAGFLFLANHHRA